MSTHPVTPLQLQACSGPSRAAATTRSCGRRRCTRPAWPTATASTCRTRAAQRAPSTRSRSVSPQSQMRTVFQGEIFVDVLYGTSNINKTVLKPWRPLSSLLRSGRAGTPPTGSASATTTPSPSRGTKRRVRAGNRLFFVPSYSLS